jgi:hypothetical protein
VKQGTVPCLGTVSVRRVARDRPATMPGPSRAIFVSYASQDAAAARYYRKCRRRGAGLGWDQRA